MIKTGIRLEAVAAPATVSGELLLIKPLNEQVWEGKKG